MPLQGFQWNLMAWYMKRNFRMTIWNKARDLHRLASLLDRLRIFFKIHRKMESSFSLLVCRSHRGLSGPSGAGGRLSSTGTMAPLSDGAGTTLRPADGTFTQRTSHIQCQRQNKISAKVKIVDNIHNTHWKKTYYTWFSLCVEWVIADEVDSAVEIKSNLISDAILHNVRNVRAFYIS